MDIFLLLLAGSIFFLAAKSQYKKNWKTFAISNILLGADIAITIVITVYKL